MQIFISEYLTCGAWAGRVSESLVDEGRAMLLAFASDAVRIPDVNVITTWDCRLGRFPLDSIDAHIVGNCDEEAALFRRFAKSADAVLAIAPETENLLLNRYDATIQAGGRWIGASRFAIQMTTDKLACFQRLHESGVATIPTVLLTAVSALPEGKIVVKPRDGAGADETFVIDHAQDVAGLPLSRGSDDYVAQPLIDGDSVSCFCVVSGQQVHIFPTVRQKISRTIEDGRSTGRLRYLGGAMPLKVDVRELVNGGLSAIGVTKDPSQNNCPISCERQGASRRYSTHFSEPAASAMPLTDFANGPKGHFGIDILIPRDGRPPMIVEINPRLTTSYVGYRKILDHNVAERILFPERFDTTIKSNGCRIEFDTAGMTKLAHLIEDQS